MPKKISLNPEVVEELTYEQFRDSFGRAFFDLVEADREGAMRKEYKKLTGKDPERSLGQTERYEEEEEKPKRKRKK